MVADAQPAHRAGENAEESFHETRARKRAGVKLKLKRTGDGRFASPQGASGEDITVQRPERRASRPRAGNAYRVVCRFCHHGDILSPGETSLGNICRRCQKLVYEILEPEQR